MPSLRAIILGRSSFTEEGEMPWGSALWRMTWKSSLDSRSAFEGMHPTLRHVPPSAASFSTRAVFSPNCAARMAQTYPPGPAPITIRSKDSITPLLLQDKDRDIHHRGTEGTENKCPG